MKKIILSLTIAASVFSFSSCDDFLDTKSPSEFSEEVVYSNTAYADYAMVGCYALLTQDQIYSNRLNLIYAQNSDIEYRGADASSYNDNGDRGLPNYMANSSNTRLANEWTMIYKLIERCNLVIEGSSASPVLQSGNSDDVKKMYAIYGEALTLRALAHFELIRNWGDVPYKTESTKSDLSNIYDAPMDRDSIMDHLISDLQTAQQHLPWLGSGGYGTSERITKAFAKGLMARIALARGGWSIRNKAGFPTERGSNWQTYYQLANQQCKEIMDQGTHKLNTSYVDIWKNLCAYNMSGTENLFEVALGLGRSGEIGYSTGIRFYTNTKYGYGNNTNVVNTSLYYFYSFDQADLRRDITVAYYQYGDGTGVQKELFKKNPMDFNFGKWDQRWMNQQFSSMNLAASGKFGYGINWSMMRYSDVLLMFAETDNALNGGPTTAAKDALKQVRRRAFDAVAQSSKVDSYVDGLGSESAFFDAIVNERAWEFGGEGIRKFDLIRWNLLMPKIEEQRVALNKMFKQEYPITVFDKTLTFIPGYLYYKYEDNAEIIDKASFNFFEDRGSATISGYEQVKWLWASSDTDKEPYYERITKFSSGLQKSVNGSCENRHLFPLASSTINDSNGSLSNSYGFQ